MKKILAIICALALILTMASCGGTDRSGTSVTGKVTGIDGTKITLSLGEISESEQGGGQGGGQGVGHWAGWSQPLVRWATTSPCRLHSL